MVHVFPGPDTESDMGLRREESALFGKFVRTFIPQTTNMGFYPVNAEIVVPTVPVGFDRFSTLQRHHLLALWMRLEALKASSLAARWIGELQGEV